MQQTITKYGVLAGLVMVALGWANFFVTRPMGYGAAEVGGYLSIIVALTFVYFGIRHYRDMVMEGVISFRKAVRTGLLISLIPAFFMLISTIIFMVTFGDQWMDWAMESMSDEQRAQYAAAPPWMLNPLFQGVVMFGTVYLIGIIMTLISALLLKRELKPA
ncbi:MAG: DUF4199 domain-containing protein [Saprospiraceae bacterium]|nr:DUF4199 domain-containing protein [Saprospiraceae bacterium]